MRIDASQTDDAALLSSEVRRLDAALDDATAEIARLRAEVERLRLADAERDAVEWFAKFGNASLATLSNAWADHAATLRALLARHTDHDAAPAARAKACDGTGNTPSLAAGARAENREGGSGDRHPPHSSPALAATDDRPAPTAATLTRQERETLQAVRDIYESHDDDDECARIAAVVDALLARLGGGE